VQGIGAAANYCIGAALLTSVFTSKELGKVLGINVAAVYLGHSAGPFLGGFLTHHLGWRSIFLVNVLLGTIILFLIFWKLEGEWHEAKEEKFDLPGTAIYSLTLFLILYGFSHLSTLLGVWLILMGGLGIFAVIKWQGKTKTPVLNINLFRNNRSSFTEPGGVDSLYCGYCGHFPSQSLPAIYGLTPEHAV
jgi:MFS family permease